MAQTWNREISVRQLQIAKYCIHSALTTSELRERADSKRRQVRNRRLLIKQVARRLLKDDQERAALQAQEKVAVLSLHDQKNVIRMARRIAEARLSGLREGDDAKMGVVHRWYDSETGWTILHQPDRVETLTDEEGDYIRVMAWTDKDKVSFKQKEMARLFGLLQFIRTKGEMRIEMVFESLLRDETLWTEWLESPEAALEKLKEVQATILRLEDALVSDRVPARTAGKHCEGCPVKLACRQGQKFLKRQSATATSKKADPSGKQKPGYLQDNKPMHKAA